MKCAACEHTVEEQDPIYCDGCRDDLEHDNGRYVIEALEAKEAARLARELLRSLVFEGLTHDGSALVPSTALKSALLRARAYFAAKPAQTEGVSEAGAQAPVADNRPDGTPSSPATALRCVDCRGELAGTFFGAGDGTGQRFRCGSCHFRDEAERHLHNWQVVTRERNAVARERDAARAEAEHHKSAYDNESAKALHYQREAERLREALRSIVRVEVNSGEWGAAKIARAALEGDHNGGHYDGKSTNADCGCEFCKRCADEYLALRKVAEAARDCVSIAGRCHCDRGYPGGCGCGKSMGEFLEEALAALDAVGQGASGREG
jgi:hypothetical protein